MTTLREAALKAISVLEDVQGYIDRYSVPIHQLDMRDLESAVEALRSALEAPTKRIPENCGSGHCSCVECLKPSKPGLFINMIAQHVGLSEELKTPEPKDKVSVFGGPEMRKMILEKLTKSHDAKYYSNAIAACVSRSGIDGIAYDQSSFLTGYEQGKYDEEMRQGPNFTTPTPEPGDREALIKRHKCGLNGITW